MIEKVKEICSAIGYEYMGGYTGSNGTLSIRCPKCKNTLVRTWRAVRKIASGYQETFICEYCEETKRIKLQEEKDRHYAELEEQKNKQKELKFWGQSFKQVELSFCDNCGKPTWGNKYCSAECYKAYNNKRKKDRRLRKIRTVKHTFIDIRKLYNRDNGTCYLCGKKCNFEDYTTREDGTFIAGNTYPSIDHAKPLAKGGSHSWDNVRLAHRICNTRKRDRAFCG